MRGTSKQDLLEGAVVDTEAYNALEQSDFEFVLPLWLILLLALVCTSGLIWVYKNRLAASRDQDEDENQSK